MQTIFLNKINTIYRKVFDLRHSEVESVILFQVIFFILLFCLLMVKPTSAALFISEFGPEELPRAFIMVALVAGGVTQFISWMNRYPITIVIKRTILICSALFILIGLLMSFDLFGKITPYLFYLWVSIFALVSTSQYWLLGNMIFNADQAKRVFGLIGSGSIAGAALGGYFSSGISILGGAKEVAILVGLLLLICIPLTSRLISLNQITDNQSNQKPKNANGFLEPFLMIKDSSLLKSIATIVFLNVLVSKIIDYHFGVFASRTYVNEDELSAFYGFTYSTYNVIGFLIQLFITSRVIKKIGVSSTLIILPATIFISFLGLMAVPGILFAILLKMSDSSFKQSFQRSGLELAMIPIPHYIKAKVKPFIDVFIDSFATGLAGILLIILTASSFDQDYWTLILGLIFTILWLGLTYKTKKVYFQNFAQNINHNERQVLSPKEFKENLKHLLAEQRMEELQSMLLTQTKYEGLGIDDELIEMYKSGNEKLKLAIMDFLYYNPEIFVPILFKEEIKSVKDPYLKQSIMSYAVISDDYKDNEIYSIVEEEDWQMQILTIYSLVKYYGQVPYLDKTLHLNKRVPKLLEQAVIAEDNFYIRQGIAIMIMYNIDGYMSTMIQYLEGEDKLLKKICISLAPLTKDLELLKVILRLETDEALLDDRIAAISKFEEVFIQYLEHRSQTLKPKQLLIACKALGKLATQQSANMLLGFIVHTNRKVRQYAAENLSFLLSKNEQLSTIDEMIDKRIMIESKNALLLHHVKAQVSNVNYFDEVIDGHPKSFWLNLRLGLMIDKQFLLVFQLLGIKLPNTDFNYIYSQLKKRNKTLESKSLDLMKKSLKPVVFDTLKTLMTTIANESKTGHDIIPQKIKKAKLLKQLRNLNDKSVNGLVK